MLAKTVGDTEKSARKKKKLNRPTALLSSNMGSYGGPVFGWLVSDCSGGLRL